LREAADLLGVVAAEHGVQRLVLVLADARAIAQSELL
jgi:hypothetical protein